MTATAIDLSKLPSPNVVQQIDYEVILAEVLSYIQTIYPEFDATVESEPVHKVLQAIAYREMVLRQQQNDAAKSLMLAYALGTDLDQLGANFNMQRFVIQEADENTTPPTEKILESDSEFRSRIQLAFESLTTAGSTNSYIAHAKNASAQVKDISVTSPSAGNVLLKVLSYDGDGTPTTQTIDDVTAAVNADNVRPLTDSVTVEAAEIVSYTVTAELVIENAPDPEVVRTEAETRLQEYVEKAHRVGVTVPLSAIFSALHVEGVKQVNLTSPAANITVTDVQAPYCQSLTVTKTVV